MSFQNVAVWCLRETPNFEPAVMIQYAPVGVEMVPVVTVSDDFMFVGRDVPDEVADPLVKAVIID